LRPALVRAALLFVTARLSALAGVLALGGCCLGAISGVAGESETGGTTGSAGASGSTSAGATSGVSPPCSVPMGTPETITVTTLAGNGVRGFFDGSGGRDGTTQFYWPVGIVTDAAGNVYVADNGNGRIRKVDPSGNTTTLAGNGPKTFQDGTGGPEGLPHFTFRSHLR
jgi:hypothetical protein